MSDPFLITGPAVISFSGGRTSGYMLWRILQAHGGTLPDDVVVCFANTGREMPATLDFVRDCAAAWSVPIVWLEYRWKPGKHYYERVNHNSASREGEPFEALLTARSRLPNPVARFCTQDLKIRTMLRFLRAEMGWQKWTSVVGLRADEPGRVFRATAAERQTKAGTGPLICPLHEAGITEADVFDFWRAQPFDLRLAGKWEGNCDGCFLKARGAITRMMQDHPERMQWWSRVEADLRGSTDNPMMANFRADREPYARLAEIVRAQGTLPFNVFEPDIGCHEWACTE